MTTGLVAGELTGSIIDCFFRVYDGLGYGFLESVYRRALAHELRKAGHEVRMEAGIDVWYDGERVGRFRADLIVDDTVVLELKSSANLVPADHKQLLNYLRGSELDVGLLLHFGPRPAFHRRLFDLQPPRGADASARRRRSARNRQAEEGRTD